MKNKKIDNGLKKPVTVRLNIEARDLLREISQITGQEFAYIAISALKRERKRVIELEENI